MVGFRYFIILTAKCRMCFFRNIVDDGSLVKLLFPENKFSNCATLRYFSNASDNII